MRNFKLKIINYKFKPHAKERKEIYSRLNFLVIETLKFINTLPRTLVNLEIMKQLVRSITSIGANANEAEGAMSRKDFIHCFSISKKEAKESSYWLMLLGTLNPKYRIHCEKLRGEVDEVVLIISSIILSTKRNTY